MFHFSFFLFRLTDNMPKLLKKIQTGAFVIPSNIETSAGDLLRKAMCLDPIHRLSIQDMLRHPWLALSPEELVAMRAAATARRHSLRKTARAAAKAMASAAAAAAVAAAEEEEEEEEAQRLEAATAAAAATATATSRSFAQEAPSAHQGGATYSGPSTTSAFGACSLPKIGGLPWPQPKSPLGTGAETGDANLWPSWGPPASAFGNYSSSSNGNSSGSTNSNSNGSSNYGSSSCHNPFMNGRGKDFNSSALPRPTTTTTTTTASGAKATLPYPHHFAPLSKGTALPDLHPQGISATAAAPAPATPPITPPLLWPENGSRRSSGSSGNAPMDLLHDDTEKSNDLSPWSPFKAAKSAGKGEDLGEGEMMGRNVMPPLRLGGGAPTIAIPRPPGVCAGNAPIPTSTGAGFMGPSSWGASNVMASRRHHQQPIMMASDTPRVSRVASDGYQNDTTTHSTSSSSSTRRGSLRSVAFSSYSPREACMLAGLSPAVVQQVATGAAAANAFGLGRSAAEVLPLVVASLARSSPRCAAAAAASSSHGGTISPFPTSPQRSRKRANSLGLDELQMMMGYGEGSNGSGGGAQRSCRAVSLSLPAQKGGTLRARRALSLRQHSATASSHGHSNGAFGNGSGVSGDSGGSSSSSSSSSSNSYGNRSQESPMCPSSYPSTPAWAFPSDPQWRFSGDQHHDHQKGTTHESSSSSSSDDSVGSSSGGTGSPRGLSVTGSSPPLHPHAAATASSPYVAPKLTSTDRALRTSYAILESKLEDEAAARAETSAQVIGGSHGKNNASSSTRYHGESDRNGTASVAAADSTKGECAERASVPPPATAAASGLSGLLSTPTAGRNLAGNNSNGKHGGGSVLDRCASPRPLKLPALESPMTKLAGGAAAIELDSSDSEGEGEDDEFDDDEEDNGGDDGDSSRPLCFAPSKKAASTGAATVATTAAATEVPRRHWTVGIRSKMDAPRVADRVSLCLRARESYFYFLLLHSFPTISVLIYLILRFAFF